MSGVSNVRVTAGLRIGFWDTTKTRFTGGPFTPVGYYNGPDLGDHIPGVRLGQTLMEGELIFRVGVLFRPDLNRNQRLETILILENYFETMFDYEDWERDISLSG